MPLAPSSPSFRAADLPGRKLDQNERSERVPHWLRAALNALPDPDLWRYPDRRALEADLADFYGLREDQVLVSNGGDEAIQYLFADLPADTPIIAPLPTFGFYLEQCDVWPVRSIYLPVRDDLTLDIEAAFDAVAANPGGIFILIRPNNPTGESIPRETAQRLIAWCGQHGTRVLLDEAYAEFASDNLLDLLADNPHLIILRTFSKAYGLAGLRMGYLLADGELLNRLRRRVMPYNVSSVSLHLGREALKPPAQKEITDYCEKVVANRRRLFTLLSGWGIRVLPSESNFLMLDLGDRRANFIGKVMAMQGFAVRTFKRPGITGCVRFSVPVETAALEAALTLAFKPELLCLDVDGTLIDVRASFDETVLRTVYHFCGLRPDRDEILALRAAGGFNDDHVLSRELIRRHGADVPLEQVKAVFETLYFGDGTTPGTVTRETPLIDARLLDRMRKEFRIALVTGRNRREMAPGIDLLGLDAGTPCYTVDDVTHPKPDPEGIRAASEVTGCRRVWMVGDNLDDIRAAVAAGAVPIGVGENREALEKAGACAFFDHIDQIEELL